MLIIFGSVQILGLLCSWFSHHPYSSVSALLWGMGFIALFPGNVLGSLLIERLLWQSHLPTSATDVLTVVAIATINAVLWLVAVGILRLLSRAPSLTGK